VRLISVKGASSEVIESAVLKKRDLKAFLDKLSISYDVYFPVKRNNHRFLRKYTGSADDIIIGEVRPVEPIKAFFTPARERVVEGFLQDVPGSHRKPLAIFGVKACDLQGMKVQDHVFKNHGFKDPFFIRNREQNLIIGADCTCAIDTCFCLALGVQPYPTADFDLNMSTLEDSFLIEAGSDKGRALLEECASLFTQATDHDNEARDAQRAEVIKAVEKNIQTYDIPRHDRFQGIIERNYNSEIWEDEAKNCVECGGCTQICPTCHCFLLYDQKDDMQMRRLRVWDSCLLKGYARVAGGGNPRKKLWMRLRNRFDKKFDFFPKVAKVYACTGCGRCISVCPAKIDIRRVLRRLVNHA